MSSRHGITRYYRLRAPHLGVDQEVPLWVSAGCFFGPLAVLVSGLCLLYNSR